MHGELVSWTVPVRDQVYCSSSATYRRTESRKSRKYTIMSGLWKAFKRVLAFKPDGSKFYVMANAKSKAHGGSYRYPAPGSQPQAFVPGQENDDLLYDTKYYTRDSRRHPEPAFVISGPKTPKHFLANSEPLPLLGSPGNNNDDVLKYDPTGLRSAMSATNAQHREAILKVRPTHLPQPSWLKDQAAILKDLKSKGLPPVPGKPRHWDMPFDTYTDHPASRW